MALFDPSPKSSVKNLYGRSKELQDLIHHIENKRWVVLLGPRRIGKTSLARCALSEIKAKKKAILDAREESDFEKSLLYSLSSSSRLSGVQLGGGMAGSSASLGFSREFSLSSISKLLDSAGRTVMLVDEAQWLRNPRKVSSFLSHIYDYHYEKVTLVITGSAVGVMRSILEPSAQSPFYGRALTTMEIQRWSQSTSLGFLESGCKEARKKYDENELGRVVDRLDGIPGWLTLFGYMYSQESRSYDLVLKKTADEASKVLKQELENASKASLGWRRQIAIMKELARGSKRFTEIGETLRINNTALSHNLDMLERLCYVSKKENGGYLIVDPLLAEYVNRLRQPPKA